MPFSWVIVLGRAIGPTKSFLSGEIVTLAPESQITGNAESDGITERNRLGANKAIRSNGLGVVVCATKACGTLTVRPVLGVR